MVCKISDLPIKSLFICLYACIIIILLFVGKMLQLIEFGVRMSEENSYIRSVSLQFVCSRIYLELKNNFFSQKVELINHLWIGEQTAKSR